MLFKLPAQNTTINSRQLVLLIPKETIVLKMDVICMKLFNFFFLDWEKYKMALSVAFLFGCINLTKIEYN